MSESIVMNRLSSVHPLYEESPDYGCVATIGESFKAYQHTLIHIIHCFKSSYCRAANRFFSPSSILTCSTWSMNALKCISINSKRNQIHNWVVLIRLLRPHSMQYMGRDSLRPVIYWADARACDAGAQLKCAGNGKLFEHLRFASPHMNGDGWPLPSFGRLFHNFASRLFGSIQMHFDAVWSLRICNICWIRVSIHNILKRQNSDNQFSASSLGGFESTSAWAWKQMNITKRNGYCLIGTAMFTKSVFLLNDSVCSTE